MRTGGIWIHAVSAGETRATFPLIESLGEHYPDLAITLTSGSINGADQSHRFAPDIPALQRCMLPLDYPVLVNRFIEQIKPQVLIVLETEVWPNLYHYCHKKGIKILLMSVRFKETTVQRYRKYSFGLMEKTLQKAQFIGTQTEADVHHLLAMGVQKQKLQVLGNLKFHANTVLVKTEKKFWKKLVRPKKFVWTAGSVHVGEVTSLLSAHKRLIDEHGGGSMLILAPRYAYEFPAIIKRCRQFCLDHNLGCALHSEHDEVNEGTSVYLLDQVGSLLYAYRCAQVAFVGGSLIEGGGGHNILEPAMLGIPILSGSHYVDQHALYQPALKQKAIVICDDELELFTELSRLTDAQVAKKLGKKAERFFHQKEKGMESFLQILDEFIEL